jgi:hypothetical protein
MHSYFSACKELYQRGFGLLPECRCDIRSSGIFAASIWSVIPTFRDIASVKNNYQLMTLPNIPEQRILQNYLQF